MIVNHTPQAYLVAGCPLDTTSLAQDDDLGSIPPKLDKDELPTE